MCSSLGRGDNAFTVAVATRPFSEVRLERRSRLPGYCVVVWRFGHVAEPTELTGEQAAGYFADVVATGRAIEAAFEPVKVNYLLLGNHVPHLHTHVLPRYLDDPAPGDPIEWRAIAAERPIDEAVLRQQAARLRAALSVPG
jgi:diadenosine tetraphosphate (Ap4A) HIT family hydrolase